MSTAGRLDDYRWLVSEEAAGWLQRAADLRGDPVAQAARLRRDLSAARAHLVIEQTELRRRARGKFLRAERMFFTRLGLEQATDQFVAAYKARRFPCGANVADLCCGIGGDLLAVAGRGPASGVDRDPIAALLAEANVRSSAESEAPPGNVAIHVRDARESSVDEFAAWHIDPDRRPEGRRTTRPGLYEPALDVIERLLEANGDAAVKLAPAAEIPERWRPDAELEWISRRRQCRQQVAWFGRLATRPGNRRATVLAAPTETDHELSVRTVIAKGGEAAPIASRIGRYVFDPDPAVLAAGLAAALAAEHDLAALAPGVGYLTGDACPLDPALAAFEVTDVLPLDLKRLRRIVTGRGLGRLEIKKRGVPVEPEQLRRRLRLRGPAEATLLVAPVAGQVTAILARRCDP